MYQFTSGNWQQLGQDLIGGGGGDWYGASVALSADGTVLAMGANWNDFDGSIHSGSVTVYQFDATNEIWPCIGWRCRG